MYCQNACTPYMYVAIANTCKTHRRETLDNKYLNAREDNDYTMTRGVVCRVIAVVLSHYLCNICKLIFKKHAEVYSKNEHLCKRNNDLH